MYDIVTGTTDYATAQEIGERAACSADGARAALSQLVEMGIAEQHGERPIEYRRNESYFQWKRIESLAREHTVADLRKEVETLIEEDQAFQEQFDVPDPNAVSSERFEEIDHEAIHERWDALTRWRSVRSDIEILQQAVHRAERNAEPDVGTSGST